MADCQAVVEAGAAILLLECVPAELAKKCVTLSPCQWLASVRAWNDGQVLVMHDMLGVYTRKPAKFVKDFFDRRA